MVLNTGVYHINDFQCQIHYSYLLKVNEFKWILLNIVIYKQYFIKYIQNFK